MTSRTRNAARSVVSNSKDVSDEPRYMYLNTQFDVIDKKSLESKKKLDGKCLVENIFLTDLPYFEHSMKTSYEDVVSTPDYRKIHPVSRQLKTVNNGLRPFVYRDVRRMVIIANRSSHLICKHKIDVSMMNSNMGNINVDTLKEDIKRYVSVNLNLNKEIVDAYSVLLYLLSKVDKNAMKETAREAADYVIKCIEKESIPIASLTHETLNAISALLMTRQYMSPHDACTVNQYLDASVMTQARDLYDEMESIPWKTRGIVTTMNITDRFTSEKKMADNIRFSFFIQAFQHIYDVLERGNIIQ